MKMGLKNLWGLLLLMSKAIVSLDVRVLNVWIYPFVHIRLFANICIFMVLMFLTQPGVNASVRSECYPSIYGISGFMIFLYFFIDALISCQGCWILPLYQPEKEQNHSDSCVLVWFAQQIQRLQNDFIQRELSIFVTAWKRPKTDNSFSCHTILRKF